MPNYLLSGTRGIKIFMRANGIDKNLLPRIASSVNIPIIHFANEDGQTAETFTRKISEAQAEALAAILGTTIANLFGSGLAETT